MKSLESLRHHGIFTHSLLRKFIGLCKEARFESSRRPQAPCEAEAQCAELTRGGKVWATATEDMDALTLGAPLLLRHVTMSEARKLPILEITLQTVLEELSFTREQVRLLMRLPAIDSVTGAAHLNCSLRICAFYWAVTTAALSGAWGQSRR